MVCVKGNIVREERRIYVRKRHMYTYERDLYICKRDPSIYKRDIPKRRVYEGVTWSMPRATLCVQTDMYIYTKEICIYTRETYTYTKETYIQKRP